MELYLSDMHCNPKVIIVGQQIQEECLTLSPPNHISYRLKTLQGALPLKEVVVFLWSECRQLWVERKKPIEKADRYIHPGRSPVYPELRYKKVLANHIPKAGVLNNKIL